jgi:anti-sigma B factor antagonist
MAEAHFSCYTRRENRSVMLALEGTLDIATAPQALLSLQRFLEEHGPDVVVDTSRLDFIDSKGVGALLSAAKASRDAGGRLFLHDPTLPVQKILETCGLTSLFPPPPAPQAAAPEAPPSDGARSAGAAVSGRTPARTPKNGS